MYAARGDPDVPEYIMSFPTYEKPKVSNARDAWLACGEYSKTSILYAEQAYAGDT